MTTTAYIKRDLRRKATSSRAKASAWYFKTGKGEYAEGDRFIGVTSPDMRDVAKKYASLCSRADIVSLLHSAIHEERQVALLMMVRRFEAGDRNTQKQIFRDYLAQTASINNWDLVDISAPHIVGAYLEGGNKNILVRLAGSKSLWERRISIVATLAFIRVDDFNSTLKVARILLNDTQDLIHKATGWMLREIGKRDQRALETFLVKYYKKCRVLCCGTRLRGSRKKKESTIWDEVRKV